MHRNGMAIKPHLPHRLHFCAHVGAQGGDLEYEFSNTGVFSSKFGFSIQSLIV